MLSRFRYVHDLASISLADCNQLRGLQCNLMVLSVKEKLEHCVLDASECFQRMIYIIKHFQHPQNSNPPCNAPSATPVKPASFPATFGSGEFGRLQPTILIDTILYSIQSHSCILIHDSGRFTWQTQKKLLCDAARPLHDPFVNP